MKTIKRRIFFSDQQHMILAFAKNWTATETGFAPGAVVCVSETGYGMLLKVESDDQRAEYWRSG